MPNSIGVPTSKTMGSSFGDYGVGLAGGLVFGLARQFLGNGILSSLVAPVAAGSIIKGSRGTVIATLAGYQAGQELSLGGLLGGGGASSGGRGEM